MNLLDINIDALRHATTAVAYRPPMDLLRFLDARPAPAQTAPSVALSLPAPLLPAPVLTPRAPVAVPDSFDRKVALRPPSLGKEVRIAVVGTRTFRDWQRFQRELDAQILRITEEKGSTNVVLVSGGAEGPDSLARRYAAERRLHIIEYQPNWSVHGKSAAFMRNRQIVQAAHAVVAYWDGVSRGTKYTIDLAEERGVPVHVVTSDQTSGAPAAEKHQKGPSDLTRILGLSSNAGVVVPDQTEIYMRPGISRDTLFPGPLKPVQSEALYWAQAQGGLVGAIGVGGGKTLLSFLLPIAVQSRVSVLFVPPHLYRKTLRDYAKLRLYWRMPTLGDYRKPVNPAADLLDLGGAESILYIVSMGQLSTAANSDLLDRLEPDLIIVDEAHYLRGNKSARSKRFARYFQHRSRTKACLLSGTMTNSALTDYWHLCRWALKDGSPLPLNSHTSQVFDAVFGTKTEEQRRSEAHARGADVPNAAYLGDIAQRYCKWAGVDDPSEAFKRRLVTTPGWVATSAVDCDAGLVLVERTCDVPAVVQNAIKQVEDSWQTPDGDEFESALELEQALQTLSAGFYNVWEWPDAVVDEEWLEARRHWSRAVRTVLKKNLPHLDSPLLVERACVRGDERVQRVIVELEAERRVLLTSLWSAWQKVKHRPAPGTKPVWISDFLCREAIERANVIKGGVVLWYYSPAVGKVLKELTGWPTFGAGDTDARALNSLAQQVLDGDVPAGPIICSWYCHGTGKNLQGWDRSIVVQTPGRGDTIEQLLGRLHRPGQRADEVTFEWFLHTDWARKSMAKARVEADYQQRTLGQPQRLLLATVESDEDFAGD